MTKTNNEWNINFLLNSSFTIWLIYTSKVSFSRSTTESTLLVSCEVMPLYFFFNVINVHKSYILDEFLTLKTRKRRVQDLVSMEDVSLVKDCISFKK